MTPDPDFRAYRYYLGNNTRQRHNNYLSVTLKRVDRGCMTDERTDRQTDKQKDIAIE